MVSFSERLKEAMELRGKRQVDICRDLGLNKGTVSGYMSGAHVPDTTVIGQLAKYFRVDPAWLIGYEVGRDSLSLSDEERVISILYRNADEVCREAVRRILAYKENEHED